MLDHVIAAVVDKPPSVRSSRAVRREKAGILLACRLAQTLDKYSLQDRPIGDLLRALDLVMGELSPGAREMTGITQADWDAWRWEAAAEAGEVTIVLSG